jgi:multiple sugar transport system substrate-binding protein
VTRRGWLIAAAAFALLGACGAPAPQPAAEKVIVKETVIVEGKEVVKEVEKVVTATPEPVASPYDDNAPIKVWVDSERQRQADMFVNQFPEKGKLIEFIADDLSTLSQKMLFWNNVGGGWPDMVWAQPEVAHLLNTQQFDFFPLDLTPWLPQEALDGFLKGTMDPCITPDKKIICVRNDFAPEILYYNQPKMKEFGYDIPKTWEEYIALGERVAQEHPGYKIGVLDGWVPEDIWYYASECPILIRLTPTKFRVNIRHPNCQRVTDMLDKLLKLGVLDTQGTFSKGLGDEWKAGKMLMQLGPPWLAQYVVQGTYLDADNPDHKGIVGVAPIPNWAAQTTRWTSGVGGGAFAISRHTKNPKLAAELIIFMTTDVEAGRQQASLPAFGAGADAWAESWLTKVPVLSPDPDPWSVVKNDAGVIWYDISYQGPPQSQGVLAPIFTDIAAGKKTVNESLDDIQKVLEEQVIKTGYELETTGP